ncbi:NO-inducible flavohemoprotein [Alteribacillus iranensis]|uniref:Flavohemoprotein n=1 Tax=Alteribacillus iranensis TaxID=930128 RepID=A0A1I2F0U2_9BACI|nr:NO-inducible flavohemoprotein [Alteribacillus iranensis]SFE98603.1 nitric oxide dioxygenase [Alteribacillus iranensis]
MLDSNTLQIVKETAPVLKEHSREIGTTFYKKLFTKAPELYNIFNQTNQQRGIQQEALAYSVYAAGQHIDRLEEIEPLVERITEKHVALGVKAEQYPVVGETLLEAVQDVLGDAATDEIIGAWKEAYDYIADIFITKEQELYDDREEESWLGFRDFRVDEKVTESNEVTSFYLKPADGKSIASYEPGQYLTLKADIEGETYTHMRHYSLSDAPGQDYYRISVKREEGEGSTPDGIVSNHLHRNVKKGDTLAFAAPAGDFTLDTGNAPIVLISGGIGITPLLSMLNTMAATDTTRPVLFIHATENSTTHVMREHVEQLAAKNDHITSYVCYNQPIEEDRREKRFDKEGYIDYEWLTSILPEENAHYYFCGPVPFMKAINEHLKKAGVPKERSHYEVFNPVSVLEEAPDQ